MPYNEQPPRPPENHNLQFALGFLAYLAAYQQRKKEADVFVIAPISASGGGPQEKNSEIPKSAIYPTKGDIIAMYSCLKSILLSDLETSNMDITTILRQRRLYEKKKQSIEGLDMLIALVSHAPDDLFDIFIKKAESIKSESFSGRFGYTTVVRGLNDEVLTMTHEVIDNSEEKKASLYLGMTVRYRKKLGPPKGNHPLAKGKHPLSPGTGPLEGEGKIVRISIPKIGPVPDQAVTLLVKDGKITTETFLAIDELILE